MKSKQMMLFAVAVCCGLVAMIGAQQVLSGNKQPEQEMVKILVAKGDIDPGVPLDKTNVGFKEWPKDNLPEGAITKEEEYAEHALKLRITTNMPVLTPYLGPKGQVGISSMIPKGMMMVTLPVDSTMTHSGLLRAGSYVTVTCAVNRPSRDNGGRETMLMKTVLKRVKVIAVGDKIAGTEVSTKEPNAAKVENVSFVVFPRQANLLNLAKEISKGRMQLGLLGEEDKSTEDTQDLDQNALDAAKNDLLGEKAAELLENAQRNNTPKEPEAPAKQRPLGGSFSEYLKQQPVSPEVADVGKRLSKSVWVVEIWNGDKKDIHEIELEDEPIVEKPVSAPTVSDQWTAPLMRFFTRKKSDTPAIEETQNDKTEDMRSNSHNDKSASGPVKSVRQ